LEPKAHGEVLPALDWFWVKVAIKGGLAAVLGIICLEWLHPPGSGSFPLMAWLVTIMGRPFLRAGGSGDLRAFQTALAGSLVLAGCAVLLLLTTPLLANYALMNLALFLVLFAFGFLTARIAGINFWMQLAYLTISSFVGLNPQEPVASQTIINTFLGLMFGIWTATVVGRLIWPVLPQYVLRDDLLGLCGRLQALLNREPHREKIQAQLAVLPLEALQAVGQLRMAGCSGEERTRLAALVRGLQMLVTRMSQLVSRRALLREMVEPRLRLEFDCLDVEFKQVLEAFGVCFRQGDGRRSRARWPAWIRPSKRFVIGTGLRTRYRQKRRGNRWSWSIDTTPPPRRWRSAAACWAACSSSATGAITPCSRLLCVWCFLPQQFLPN